MVTNGPTNHLDFLMRSEIVIDVDASKNFCPVDTAPVHASRLTMIPVNKVFVSHQVIASKPLIMVLYARSHHE